MIIIKLQGGLGNQMFQYAYAKALQSKGYNVKLDRFSYFRDNLRKYELGEYNVSIKPFFLARVFNKLFLRLPVYKVKRLLDDNIAVKSPDNKCLDGYFQSEKYFLHERNIILKEFTIKNKLSNYAIEIEEGIKNSKISCSIHVRRGDYILDKNLSIHGICSLEYYKRAIKIIENKYKKVLFFVFSDDNEWVKENIRKDNVIYIDNNKTKIPHEDIYLMSLCSNNIIANSSFSWWGAWLNRNINKTVIAPKVWFANDEAQKQSADMVPVDWIRI